MATNLPVPQKQPLVPRGNQRNAVVNRDRSGMLIKLNLFDQSWRGNIADVNDLNGSEWAVG